MRSMLLLVPLLAFASFIPSAEAAQPPPQCIGSSCCFAPCEPFQADVCVEGVNAPDCYRGDVCVSASRMVPVCADVPCYGPIDCFACGDDIAWACNLDPCASRYFLCTSPPSGSSAPPELVCAEDCNPCGTLVHCGPLVCGIPCDIDCSTACNVCNTMDCVPEPIELKDGPEPMCMYYYHEVDTGIVRYVQRDSCHSEIYVDGERVK